MSPGERAEAHADEQDEPLTAPDTTLPFGIDWTDRTPAWTTKVGIVMRTRDRPVLLPRAIDSVINQTFEDWHLVIVNHGGDPQPVDLLVDSLDDAVRKKIEILHLESGGGMERASNAGMARLDARYIAVHDDDDTWMPRFLERTVGFLDDPEHQSYGAVVTHAYKRWERIEDDRVEFVDDAVLNAGDAYIDTQRLLGWNRFLPINFLFRSALIDVIGGFNEQLPVIGDWDFHMRVAAVTEIGMIPEVLARYHLRHDDSDAEYHNTITAGEAKHLETDARVRGALLRRLIAADPSRLGLVVALSHDAEMARRQADRIEELVRLIDWRTHHTGNRINDSHERIIRMDDTLHALARRMDDVEARLGDIRADTARLRRGMAIVALPLKPFRLARERWRLRHR